MLMESIKKIDDECEIKGQWLLGLAKKLPIANPNESTAFNRKSNGILWKSQWLSNL